jgi:purine-cytosine permease-like protein
MDNKTYYQAVAIIFAIIAIGHAARLYNGWVAVIGSIIVPLWVSWVAVLIAGYLAVRGWQFAQKKGR